MSFDIQKILRPHLRNFKAYSSARTEYTGKDAIFLDANENPFGSASGEELNRYPDPLQSQLKAKISEIKNIATEQIFIGNGSDEVIDLLYRAFCEPGVDNVIICPPTYGMYETSANLNNISIKEVYLTRDFHLQTEQVIAAIDAHTKMIFICNPNNPTGNLLKEEDIKAIVAAFDGLVVIDEAYIDFSNAISWISKLQDYPNVVVMQTLSKAWGMAGIRVGMAFASKEIIKILTAIKPPYNVSVLAQQAALKALDNEAVKLEMAEIIMSENTRLVELFGQLDYVQKIYPTHSNFILMKVKDPNHLYKYLTEHQVVVRNRNTTPLCEGCVRISVGTPDENVELVKWMQAYQ
ncbi:MAG: histidinol-phosphate transaminase [Chitinophagales bacterium]|nr:histidinol-phosphate transaminase [Chitinophagales bacterium]